MEGGLRLIERIANLSTILQHIILALLFENDNVKLYIFNFYYFWIESNYYKKKKEYKQMTFYKVILFQKNSTYNKSPIMKEN